MDTVKISDIDNVEVELATGHKVACRDIAAGEQVIKYGFPIGIACADIKKGERVHTNNLKTGLGDLLEYEYEPVECAQRTEQEETIEAYVRRDGSVGIRNDIWIINTVGCVNNAAKAIAEKSGAFYFPHPYGCSQLGGDMKTTQLILRGLVNHPNAAGVLVLGLGCENNNIDEFKKVLGDVDGERVRFLNAQEVSDEIAEGVRIVEELKEYAKGFKRERVGISKLKVGLKCGGSDGLSGITANPLVGRFCDKLTAQGGSAVMTEVPEMFGAETILMNRCADREIFEKNVKLINDFKEYFKSNNQPVYENPSPGNKAGGITTLEEKSLGCVQKGGTSKVTDVLDYGDTVTKPGLNLLNGPGNDIVAVTNLTAAGCQLILFTTGRGTPLGAPVPTIKIATNTALAEKKSAWIDFDAQAVPDENKLFTLVKETADGRLTKNEERGFREIAIFKSGVTL